MNVIANYIVGRIAQPSSLIGIGQFLVSLAAGPLTTANVVVSALTALGLFHVDERRAPAAQTKVATPQEQAAPVTEEPDPALPQGDVQQVADVDRLMAAVMPLVAGALASKLGASHPEAARMFETFAKNAQTSGAFADLNLGPLQTGGA